MSFLCIDLEKINLHDDNDFYKDDLETIIHVRLLDWHDKFEKSKTYNLVCFFEPKMC